MKALFIGLLPFTHFCQELANVARYAFFGAIFFYLKKCNIGIFLTNFMYALLLKLHNMSNSF